MNRLECEMAAREYADFLAKFDAKKTTDDCFTPPAVFAAVHQWAAAELKAAAESTEWSLSPREQRIIERLNARRAQPPVAVAQAGLFAKEATHV